MASHDSWTRRERERRTVGTGHGVSTSLRFLAKVLNLAAESIKKEFLFHFYSFFVGAQLTSLGRGFLALTQAHFSRWLFPPLVQPAEELDRENLASVVHSLHGRLWGNGAHGAEGSATLVCWCPKQRL